MLHILSRNIRSQAMFFFDLKFVLLLQQKIRKNENSNQTGHTLPHSSPKLSSPCHHHHFQSLPTTESRTLQSVMELVMAAAAATRRLPSRWRHQRREQWWGDGGNDLEREREDNISRRERKLVDDFRVFSLKISIF